MSTRTLSENLLTFKGIALTSAILSAICAVGLLMAYENVSTYTQLAFSEEISPMVEHSVASPTPIAVASR